MTDAVPVDRDLSDAVVAYLAYGDATSWRRRPDAVAGGVRPRVEAVVAEADATAVEWGDGSLARAGDLLVEQLAARHPELSPEALAALRWKWTFDQR